MVVWPCLGCGTTQPVGTTTDTVVRDDRGRWLAAVSCNDCGSTGAVPVSNSEAAVLLYWLTARHPSRLGRSVVVEAEQIVREAARG